MSNTKQQIEEILDYAETFYNDSRWEERERLNPTYTELEGKIDRLVTEAILEKLKSICQDNWQCFIPEKYMLDQIKELQFQLTNKDTK